MSTHDQWNHSPEGAQTSAAAGLQDPAQTDAAQTDTEQTEVLQPNEGAPAVVPQHPKRPRRRGLRALIWAVGAVVVLIGMFFVADAIVRQVAQNEVSSQIQKELPPDVTAKDLTVTIHGFSVIGQFIAGRFDQVDLDAAHATVQGAPLSARVVAYDVPTDFSKPVGRIDGSVVISQDSVNQLVQLPDATSVTLGDNTVGLKGTGQILGISVQYTASVTPTLKNGDTVVLTPHDVSVKAGGGTLDVTRFAKDLLPQSIPICVAQYLPKGVEATGLAVQQGSASISVGATDFVVDDASLQSKGTCG